MDAFGGVALPEPVLSRGPPRCRASSLRAPFLPGLGGVAGEHAPAGIIGLGNADAKAGHGNAVFVAKCELLCRAARAADRQATCAAVGGQLATRRIGRIGRACHGAGRRVAIVAQWPHRAGRRRRAADVCGWRRARRRALRRRGAEALAGQGGRDRDGQENTEGKALHVPHRTRHGRSPAAPGRGTAQKRNLANKDPPVAPMRCQQPSRELPMKSECRLPSCVLAFALAWLAGACLPDDGPYGVHGTGGNTGTGGGGGGSAGSAGGNVGSGGSSGSGTGLAGASGSAGTAGSGRNSGLGWTSRVRGDDGTGR